MQDIKEIDLSQLDGEKRYRLKDVGIILGKTSQNIGYLLKRKYFKKTKVVGGTPKNKRIAIKGQSIIEFIQSWNQ